MSEDEKKQGTIRWVAEKLAVPLVVAIITTAAYSEYLLNFFSIRSKSPNWQGTTSQPKDSTGKPDIFRDNWVFDAKDGRVNAKIKKSDSTDDSYWIAQGNKSHGVITVSYQTNSSENTGIGSFYLQQVANTQEYRGHQITYDCDTNKVLVCPYILAPIQESALINKQTESVNFLAQQCQELGKMPLPSHQCSNSK